MNMHVVISSSATVRSGIGIFALGLVAVGVLSACGGGDPVTVSTSSTTTTPKTFLASSSPATPTLTVTAGTLRYMIQGLKDGAAVSLDGTTAVALTYGTNNSVIGIANNSLAATGTTPTYAVQYFMGDTKFALGRWTKGLPTISGSPSTPLTGTDSTAVHYLISRDLGVAPVDGNYPCSINQVWTSGLTYSGNATGTTAPSDTSAVGGLLPNAKITVTGGVPTLSVSSITLYAGPQIEIATAHTVTFATPGPKEDTTSSSPSQYLAGFEGIGYVLGEGPAADSIALGIAFRRTMSTGARYKGMSRVLCTKA